MSTVDRPSMKWLFGPDAMKALQERGFIPKGVRRVVIEIPCDDYATMYIERLTEVEVLDVVLPETKSP